MLRPAPLRIGPQRLGELQSAVLDVLWSDGGWHSPAEVREALGSNRAYTTIMTVLSRMARQGFVDRRLHGNGFQYRATRSRGEFGSERLLSVLSEAGDPGATLARFVAHLDPDELAALRTAIEKTAGAHGA
jgi:predicted transcriptional regulator